MGGGGGGGGGFLQGLLQGIYKGVECFGEYTSYRVLGVGPSRSSYKVPFGRIGSQIKAFWLLDPCGGLGCSFRVATSYQQLP